MLVQSGEGRGAETPVPSLPRNCYKTPHGFVFRIVVPEPLRPAQGESLAELDPLTLQQVAAALVDETAALLVIAHP